MNKVDNLKNILDLKHQKYLNYYTMIVILIITSFVTVVIGTREQWGIKTLLPTTIFILSLIIIIGFYFEYLFKNINIKIRNLTKKSNNRI